MVCAAECVVHLDWDQERVLVAGKSDRALFVGNSEGVRRAKEMLRALTPVQKAMVTDQAPHVSGLCPRRSGKSYAASTAALVTGEVKPGAISLIISLNLKQLKRIFWSGGPSGLFTLDRKFGLGLDFNKTECRWQHQNGSIGYLLGSDDADQLEVIRGLEADLYVVDECKSFAPRVLEKLIDDIVDPQRATRRGRLLLIGTPGNHPSGPFYQATSELSRDQDGRPFLIGPGTTDDWGRTAESDLLWSAHSWTLQDNTAAPHQWEEALRKKRNKRWSDDEPVWKREYLGKWTNVTEGTVYRYADMLSTGKVSWVPARTDDNPTGLPIEGKPWHLIGGLDLGFQEPTAFVVAAYSQRLGELRHVWDTSTQHMLVPDVAEMIREAQRKFGKLETIYADVGNLGKMVVETLVKDGFPLERADKREKNDHIELLNGSFYRGEVKIVEDTKPNSLHNQLITNQWALGDNSFSDLARAGRLVEDKSVPNDTCDAFLYLYRGAQHRYGRPDPVSGPDEGTREWVAIWEKDQLRRARAETRGTPFDRALRGDAGAPQHLRRALTKGEPWTSTSTH